MTTLLERVGARGSLRRNILSNGVGGLTTMGGQLVAVPLGLLVVGVPAYGAWSTIVSIVQYAALFDLGIAAATLRQVALRAPRTSAALPAVLRTSLVAMSALGLLVGAAVAAVVLALMPLLATPMGVRGGFPPIVVAAGAGLTVLAGLVGRHFQSVNQGIQRYDVERTHQVTAMALRLLLLAAAAVLHWGIEGLVPIELLAVALPGLLSAARIRLTAPLYSVGRTPLRDLVVLRSLLHYGTRWFWLNSVLQAVVLLPTALVGVVAGPAPAAAMAAATRIALGTRQVLAWVLEPIVPAMSGEGRAALARIVPVTRLLLLVGAAVIVPSMAIAYPFMHWWIGRSGVADTAAIVSIGLSAAMLVTIPHLAFNAVRTADGTPSYYLPETVAWGALTISALIAGARAGAWGIAAAILVPAVLLEFSFIHRMLVVTGPIPGLRRCFAQAAALIVPAVAGGVAVQIGLGRLNASPFVVLIASGLAYVTCGGLAALVLPPARAAVLRV